MKKKSDNKALVSVVMGSQSDWATMKECCEVLDQLRISFEVKIISAHRTPERLFSFSKKVKKRGIKVIIDLVLNHTSSQHPWFLQSSNSQNNFRDWYIWSDNNPGITGPWGQNVWHYNQGNYYYGLFWSGMPDLNFEHLV